MTLLAVGINHKTAPLEIREKVAFSAEEVPLSLGKLISRQDITEAAIISTCNRTEVYCNTDFSSEKALVAWLGEHHCMSVSRLQEHLYAFSDADAVRHLLRVAAGLDSMILGEPQILGQVKSAYQQASMAGTLGGGLDRLFQHCFSVAKQIRTDTRIGASPVSIAFAAVSLAKQFFGDTESRCALLIGAGETIELAARHLCQQGVGNLIVANRTLERAHQLASRFSGLAITLEEIGPRLAMADIVISSTGSSDHILLKPTVEKALKARKHRPIYMVDIAVPRDIDPEIATLNDVYLYTVDDLEDIIADNLRSRRAAAQQAEEIIDTSVDQFLVWLRSLDAVDSIRQLRAWADQVREETLLRAKNQLEAGRPAPEVLEHMASLITKKLIHGPCHGMRAASAEGRDDLVETIRGLYSNTRGDPL
jgi:glutamyl-tRNA reductase